MLYICGLEEKGNEKVPPVRVTDRSLVGNLTIKPVLIVQSVCVFISAGEWGEGERTSPVENKKR